MWFWLALCAAVIWGFEYVFAEKVLDKVSVSSYVFLQFVFGFLLVAGWVLAKGHLGQDLKTIISSRQILIFLAINIICFLIGEALIAASVQNKNAAVAGLVEISYPFFIVLFTWVIFREVSINLFTFFGGLLILSGVSVIYFSNR